MITCQENSVLPIDHRVIEYVSKSPAFRLILDPEYLAALPELHGGVPISSYFTTPNGEVRQIGWFVSYLDADSTLPEPFEPAFYFQNNDGRIDDKSIPGIISDEVSPYLGGERIVPFAALITNGAVPLSLRLYTLDSSPDDSLCFDVSTTPHSIVVCNGHRAAEEILKWDDGDIDEVNYDNFLEHVADSFAEFAKLLRQIP